METKNRSKDLAACCVCARYPATFKDTGHPAVMALYGLDAWQAALCAAAGDAARTGAPVAIQDGWPSWPFLPPGPIQDERRRWLNRPWSPVPQQGTTAQAYTVVPASEASGASVAVVHPDGMVGFPGHVSRSLAARRDHSASLDAFVDAGVPAVP